MVSWRPKTFGLTPEALLKVGASDAENDQLCPQQAYVKSHFRSRVTGTHGWEKTWDNDYFPLKYFLSALEAYLYSGGRPERDRIAASRRTYVSAHPGVRNYLDSSLENYLDFLGAREAENGTDAVYLGYDHLIRVKSKSGLSVWAPAFEFGGGHIEIHRLRLKGTRPEVTNWAHIAAYIASRLPGRMVETISILDVSLYHDPHISRQDSVLIDRITPVQAEALYQSNARSAAISIVTGGPPSPGHECGDCKVAGVCDALVPMDGALQQEVPGPYTRAISAQDLNVYERCPSRWYMEKKCHLPGINDENSHGATDRGRSVHSWLKIAHSRGLACTPNDLPIPSERGADHVAFSALDAEQYATALPYLLTHLEHCPLHSNAEVLLTDETIYGWDATADVVVACRPDLTYRLGDALVLRETKTTESVIPNNPDEARDAYDGIVYWLLNMCSNGYLDHFNTKVGIVELEILGPKGSVCYTYNTDDFALSIVAETRVRHKVADWHEDTSWATKPSLLCKSCPMAIWCPDRDTYKDMSMPATSAIGSTGAPF
jgi:hypothetical protein